MADAFAVPKLYQESCSKVMDYLYIGDKKSAKSKALLTSMGIHYICNVTPPRNQGGVHNVFSTDECFTYLRCPCIDSDVEHISQYFAECIKFIHNARLHGDGVLVHCMKGQSRSAAIILAYLIAKESWTLKAAYSHLKSVRPKVKVNSNFLRQLIQFEQQQQKTKVSCAESEEKKHEKNSEDAVENDTTRDGSETRTLTEKTKKHDANDTSKKAENTNHTKSNLKKRSMPFDDAHIDHSTKCEKKMKL
mmetsp:Transcript_27790/g.45842  ORF Transcript_27790/g.45842 Transcript_27790/m.45842 type:complete len:248 (-) Transcript_27790:47-790(-)|eukprot:CAMPEP_0202713958 /NCGR_PEP_ID=MMETSP1385-20130828/62027_1 /ASSEMBLY_ACC=CAM_ASM_000861 /TAXON_ID=933848 /ORGANISM="Elphidium margaritaceum" /LENGTH=247 /DNA_ID=CAMNT_0049374515 /DNA_START=28 /DNA_END=771 /DNA_ORIENTATION=-